MGFWDKIFRKTSQTNQPNIRFGRFSDAYKSDEQYIAWDKAMEQFEQNDYVASVLSFLDYLKTGKGENITIEKISDTHYTFSMLQGSKRIEGVINENIVRAEAKIAAAHELNIGFLRKFIEFNFELKYSRFALTNDNVLVLISDSKLNEASPYKLYYGLKEVAINADKEDDLLISEFPSLSPININHINDIPESEKQIKFDYLKSYLQSAFQIIQNSSLNSEKYPGALTYLYLEAVYRLDYLIQLEGKSMELLEGIHRNYFAETQKTPNDKVLDMRKELDKVVELSKDVIFKELYKSEFTFGITEPGTHDMLVNVIDTELKSLNWYIENNHHAYAKCVISYILGYASFNYAMPAPTRDFIQLYYNITSQPYFNSLGFTFNFWKIFDEQLNPQPIEQLIQEILDAHDEKYPELKKAVVDLDFNSPLKFYKSYLLFIRNLDMTQKSKQQ